MNEALKKSLTEARDKLNLKNHSIIEYTSKIKSLTHESDQKRGALDKLRSQNELNESKLIELQASAKK